MNLPPVTQAALPLALRVGRASWFLASEWHRHLIDTLAPLLSRTPALPADAVVLKQTDRKIVFRIPSPARSVPPAVVKVFFLRTFSHRRKWDRFALDEATNLLTAAAHGIRTPPVQAYAHVANFLGRKTACLLVMNLLEHHATVAELLAAALDRPTRVEILQRALPLFEQLHQAGCNHIDLSPTAVMFDTDHPDALPALLDMQHARFHPAPNLEILMFEAAYFHRSASPWTDQTLIAAWMEDLLDRIGVMDGASRRHLLARFADYYTTHLSRKQRKLIH